MLINKKLRRAGILILFIGVIFAGSSLGTKNKPTAQGYFPPNPKEGLAVLELFSSQGCNSCPPADKLLKRNSTESNSTKPKYYHP